MWFLEWTQSITEEQKVLEGIQFIMPMFGSPELTDPQKAALVMMLQKMIEDTIQWVSTLWASQT